jgi:hypothetical protein
LLTPGFVFRSDAAPSVVVQVSALEVMTSNEAALDISGTVQPPFSPARTASSAIKSAAGSPARPTSPFRGGITDATYSRGLQLLYQHRVDGFAAGPGCVDNSKKNSPLGGRLSTQSPAAFTAMVVPSCTLCLRRVRGLSDLSAGLAGCSDLPVCRSFTSDARLSFDELNCLKSGAFEASSEDSECKLRCLPCHIYHTVSINSETRSTPRGAFSNGYPAFLSAEKSGVEQDNDQSRLGRCGTCGMSENIWMCLQCGHTGCGRYTAQHAKAHYQEHPTHNLSLELATGRIWDYHRDAYCYYEDSNNDPQRADLQSPSGSFFRPLATISAEDESLVPSELSPRAGQASPAQCKKFMVPSFDAGQGRRSYAQQSLSDAGLDELSGLDSVTAGKISVLMSNYEQLLEAQLQDQQLYFEKLLARETVRALEQSYQTQRSGEKAGTNASAAGGTLKKAKSQKGAAKAASSAAAEEKKTIESDSEVAGSPRPDETCSMSSPLLTRSSAYLQAASELTDAEVLRGMQEVEALKLEISAMEAEYRAVLEETRTADDTVRQLKKDNDALIRTQKELVSCTRAYVCRAVVYQWLLFALLRGSKRRTGRPKRSSSGCRQRSRSTSWSNRSKTCLSTPSKHWYVLCMCRH